MSILAQAAVIDRAQPQVRPHATVRPAASVARAALTTLVVLLPFERALFDFAGVMTITNLELVAACVIVTGVWALLREREALGFPAPARATLVFLVVLLAAASSAPAESGNALKFVARMTMASLVAWVAATVVRDLADVRRLMRVLVAVATLVGAIAVLEVLQVPGVLDALMFFRSGFHVVGGQLRATSTLFYPTIASMYLEVAFAAGLWLLIDPSRRPAWQRLAAFIALQIIGAGIAATFTRAGLLGMIGAIALFAVVVLVRRRERHALVPLGALTAGVTATVLLLHSPERLATRVSVEGSQAWYGARYEVPSRVTLTTAEPTKIAVTLTNTGRLTWDSTREPSFLLAYHWISRDTESVVQFEGQRTPFPHPVRPGERLAMQADVIAPGEPGRYTLVWDVVHESRAWLSTEGVVPARTDARVDGPSRPVIETRMARLPTAPSRPARPQLWSAALAIARDHPWLGIGPDNFRLTYGRYAGIERADPRVHANNMYLEVLAGSGAIGLAALVWLLWSALRPQIARIRTASGDRLMPATAFLAASLLIVAHGLVDSFLSFTTTYLMFAVVGGMAFARVWDDHSALLALPVRLRPQCLRRASARSRRRRAQPAHSSHAHRV